MEFGEIGSVPLFPLPNVVLLPGAILPLHVFEPRYRDMMADALDDRQLIAMALLKPGWEKSYQNKPEIYPAVCVGRILNHEQLPDGRYNLLLKGLTRATIDYEHDVDKLYRLAELQPIADVETTEEQLGNARGNLEQVLHEPPLSQLEAATHFRKLFDTEISTPAIADMLAFHFIENVELKQRLLTEADAAQRVRLTVEAFNAMRTPSLSPYHRSLREPSSN